MTTRVFADADAPGPITLSAEESHYLVRVRRARAGVAIEVLGPTRGGWAAEVLDADPKRARVELGARLPDRDPQAIDLAVGLPEAKAAYEVIARATEIGARSLTFITTERSLPGRLNPERIARVQAAARRQCGRLDPVRLDRDEPLEAWLSRPRTGFIASPARSSGLPPRIHEASVLIGPEGGLTSLEEHAALQAGLIPLSLGPFVLRTEVAVVAAVAVAGRITGE